jgi:hypothetical protein
LETPVQFLEQAHEEFDQLKLALHWQSVFEPVISAPGEFTIPVQFLIHVEELRSH